VHACNVLVLHAMLRHVVLYYRLDEMKSEQAKLQNQLKEFEKKQANYEEVGLDYNSASHDLLL